MSKLVAIVGMNIGKRRFEPGATIPDTDISTSQRRHIVKAGWAEEVDAERVSPEKREAILEQAPDPNPVVEQLEKEE